MTTIATDGKTIAADGLSCVHDEIIDRDSKKLYVRDGRIYAVMGSGPLSRAAIAWHAAGAKPGDQPVGGDDAGWSIVVIEGPLPVRYVTKYTSGVPYPDEYPIPQAFGSGGDYAQGALFHGASAREAVEISAKLDTKTGGEITVINIADVLAHAPLTMAAE